MRNVGPILTKITNNLLPFDQQITPAFTSWLILEPRASPLFFQNVLTSKLSFEYPRHLPLLHLKIFQDYLHTTYQNIWRHWIFVHLVLIVDHRPTALFSRVCTLSKWVETQPRMKAQVWTYGPPLLTRLFQESMELVETLVYSECGSTIMYRGY